MLTQFLDNFYIIIVKFLSDIPIKYDFNSNLGSFVRQIDGIGVFGEQVTTVADVHRRLDLVAR